MSRTERAAFRAAERAMAAAFPCTPAREREIRAELDVLEAERRRLLELRRIATRRVDRALLGRAEWPRNATEIGQIDFAIKGVDTHRLELADEMGAAAFGMLRDQQDLAERATRDAWLLAIDAGEVRSCDGCGDLKAPEAQCAICDLSIELVDLVPAHA